MKSETRPEVSLVRTLSLILCLLLLTACGRPPELVGVENAQVPVEAVEGITLHKVFIATTRQDSEVIGALYSDQRAPDLGLASVAVSIPPNHVVGEIERPRRLPPDPRNEFAIIEPSVYETDGAFVGSLNAELRKRPPAEREILFFVHGYNQTTSDALLHVAQFVEDSGFNGVPVLFTWASAGKVSRYVYDLNSTLVARPHLIDAGRIVSRSIATGYHIFAHSMGGFLTMEALVEVAKAGRFNQTGQLRSVVLASPDIDVDLFEDQISNLSFDRVFVLLSEDDAALRASRIIAGGVPRVGAADAETLAALGVTAIDLTEITDNRSTSHSKFTGSPEVVQLIGRGLNNAPQYGVRQQTVLNRVLGDLPITVVRAGG